MVTPLSQRKRSAHEYENSASHSCHRKHDACRRCTMAKCRPCGPKYLPWFPILSEPVGMYYNVRSCQQLLFDIGHQLLSIYLTEIYVLRRGMSRRLYRKTRGGAVNQQYLSGKRPLHRVSPPLEVTAESLKEGIAPCTQWAWRKNKAHTMPLFTFAFTLIISTRSKRCYLSSMSVVDEKVLSMQQPCTL